MEKLTYDCALDLFDKCSGNIEKNKRKENNLRRYGICETCDEYLIEQQQSVWYCPKCETITNDFIVNDYITKKKNNFYYRRLYFIEKLNLIAGLKVRRTADYKDKIDILKNKEFKNIKELKKIMKKMGMNKYYRYIYNIYYDIKKIRIINITSQDVSKLSAEFVRMESEFKNNKDQHGRRNMFPYSAMIYYLLKKNNIPGHTKLLLPCEQNKVMKTINANCNIDK